MNNNPFNLMFEKSPFSIIKRQDQYLQIKNTFNSEYPSTFAYLISGIRGSGKTVMLRQIAEDLSSSPDWIVLDINSQSDLIKDLAEKFLYEGKKHKLFLDWSISVNISVITLNINKKDEISNPEIIFEKLLKTANENNKKVLITIDEVTSSLEIKRFANFYQSMIGKNYNLFLLMTGLKNNINALISSNSSSFLSRTPKINLLPLNGVDIAKEYERLLNINIEEAIKLAKLTKGYAFAYQVLGYLFFESKEKEINDKLLSDYDKYLTSNGYDVIRKDLTKKEKEFCFALAKTKSNDTKEIMEISNMKESNFQNYRKGLIEKEIVIPTSYGKLDFYLPRFKEFAKLMELFEQISYFRLFENELDSCIN